MDSERLRDWVEKSVDGHLSTWKLLTAGNSRQTWLAEARRKDPPEVAKYIVRRDTGRGPLSGTEFSLDREAAVYRALESLPVRAARLHALAPGGDAVILAWVNGDDLWESKVLPGFLQQLGVLHAVPVESLHLPGFPRSARAELDAWHRVHSQKAKFRSPFVEVGLEILQEGFPGEPDRLVLCHGDAGPGNVLHMDGAVTALVDWEFSHLGDPHDDLAWLTVRSGLFGKELEDFSANIADHYCPHVPDINLSNGRLNFWRAVVILRNLIVVLSAIENGVPGRDRFVHVMLKPRLQRLLVDALARLTGDDLPQRIPSRLLPQRGEVCLTAPGEEAMNEVAAGIHALAQDLDDDELLTRVKLMRRLAVELSESWGAPIAKVPVRRGKSLGEKLEWLDLVADRDLSCWPRTAASLEGHEWPTL